MDQTVHDRLPAKYCKGRAGSAAGAKRSLSAFLQGFLRDCN